MTESTSTRTYSVPEISCGHCKQTIESAVQGLGGVSSVEVDIDAKTVAVTGGDSEAIVTAIEDVGFDVAR
ncbi:cation transporter [Ilumatobacter coccineus]|uniref:Copper chaperone CopZ n=1 Tax=Ilumatobacter coccineus (strain NBRC 103263 / KCTC 29153 / YM16-304) TaxID=1313172 RepID=A0A6C7EBX5_ILUCY|nr:cation transporter [Ilumatobacter coccineus]BAN03502.1 copper chaperone CopZ [Ilumatobacter coccineus YM16-304]